MLKQRSPETQTKALSRVDQLLALLRAVTHDPPPALRTRLVRMSSERLGEIRSEGKPRISPRRRAIFTAPAVGITAAALIACAAFLGFLVHDEGRHGEANHVAFQEPTAPAAPAGRNAEGPPSIARPQHRTRSARSEIYLGRLGNLMIPLPYSDAAVRTGTGTMIGVSLSQDELLSLGVPVNPTVYDRRFIAQMILGDDGLPRAISVPLPLTVVEERK
jgi:hypothetical protein